MRPSKRRDARQELRDNAESVALALRDSMAEVKRVPANDDGGKEVQAGYAEMLALQCHLALSRNRPAFVQGHGSVSLSAYRASRGHSGNRQRGAVRMRR